MSTEYTTAFVKQYEEGIQLLQQQLTLYESGVRGLSEIPPDVVDDGEEV